MSENLVELGPYAVTQFSGPAGLPMIQITGIDENGDGAHVVMTRGDWERIVRAYYYGHMDTRQPLTVMHNGRVYRRVD